MTLLWFEGFEANTGSTAVVLEEYRSASSTGTGLGRLGTGASLSSGNWLSELAIEQPTENYFGIAVRATSSTSTFKHLTLYDGTDVAQCTLRSTPGTVPGTIQFQLVLSTSGTVFLSSPDQQTTGDFWRYIQFRIVLDTTAVGEAEMIVDTQSPVTVIGITTSATGTACSYFQFTGTSNGRIDDFYWVSSAGAPPYNTYLGVVKTEAIFPEGIGAFADWDPDSGDSSTNWSRVNDGAGNDEASFVSTNANGIVDTHQFNDLTFLTGTTTILALKISTRARLESAGSQLINQFSANGGSTYPTPESPYTVNTVDADGQRGTFLINPDTGTAWTPATIDSAQFGYGTTA